MKKNIGNMERGIRLAAGLAIIGAGVYYQSYWGAVGLIPVMTAGLGWCPPYALLGINTCSSGGKE